jgi:hypothetical protein
MNPSMMLLIGCCVGILLSLLTGFFGYKLARFLMPLSGLALVEGLIYIYVYDMLTLDSLSTWLFFGGTSIAIYLILFFVRRLAGFFTGLAGSALLLTYLVYALNLHSFSLLAPVVMTLAILAGLLTAAYRRAGVVISTSILGGCSAAYLGLYIYLQGVDITSFANGSILTPLEGFLNAHTLVILGVGLGLSLLSLLVQFGVTAKKQVLGDTIGGSGLRTKKNQVEDKDTWTGDMGY